MTKAKSQPIKPVHAKQAFKPVAKEVINRAAYTSDDEDVAPEISVLQGLLDDVSSRLSILSNRQDILRERLRPVSRNRGSGISEDDDRPEDECSFQTQLIAMRDSAQSAIERTNDAIANLMI